MVANPLDGSKMTFVLVKILGLYSWFFESMEHLEIVHEHTGELVGSVLPRPEAIQQQAWCRSTNIYVMNSEGAILCHKRSADKERLPGYWMTHLGGHVGVGETYESNAWKELQEEAGVWVHPHELIAWRTTKIPSARLWAREFVIHVDKPIEEFTAQPGEVEQFAWMSPVEILKAVQGGENWKAGTQDFWVEYHCLLAALATAHSHGIVKYPHRAEVWSIPQLQTV